MASHTPPSHSIEDLIEKIEINRQELSAHSEGLERSVDVKDRMQRSLHQHAALFFGSAAVLGLLLSLIPSTRRDRHMKEASKKVRNAADKRLAKAQSRSFGAVLAGLVGKMAVDLGKPILLKTLREHYAKANQHAGQGHAHASPVPPAPYRRQVAVAPLPEPAASRV